MITQFLARVVSDEALHVRFLNTLSYLEYVGARKIIKSQHEDDVDEALLEHMAEEIHHAHFLKKIIRRTFHRKGTTYAADTMLAKTAAKQYLKSIDAMCARFARDARHAYVLASYIIETRALLLYTTYEMLMAPKKSFRLASILKQEERHLVAMEASLLRQNSAFILHKEELRRREEACFRAFLASLNEEIAQHDNTAHELSALHAFEDGAATD